MFGSIGDFLFGSTPDYDDANQAYTFDSSLAKRPNTYSPYGSSLWYNRGTGQEKNIISYSPEVKSLMDAYLDRLAKSEELMANNAQGLEQVLSEPIDYDSLNPWGQLGDPNALRQRAEDATWDRYRSRLDPMWEDRQQKLDVSLRSRGLLPGDEAYENSRSAMERARNDAYSSAMQDSVSDGRDESRLAYNTGLGTANYNNQLRGAQLAEQLMERERLKAEAGVNLGNGGNIWGMNVPDGSQFSPMGVPDYEGQTNTIFKAEEARRKRMVQALGFAFGV